MAKRPVPTKKDLPLLNMRKEGERHVLKMGNMDNMPTNMKRATRDIPNSRQVKAALRMPTAPEGSTVSRGVTKSVGKVGGKALRVAGKLAGPVAGVAGFLADTSPLNEGEQDWIDKKGYMSPQNNSMFVDRPSPEVKTERAPPGRAFASRGNNNYKALDYGPGPEVKKVNQSRPVKQEKAAPMSDEELDAWNRRFNKNYKAGSVQELAKKRKAKK